MGHRPLPPLLFLLGLLICLWIPIEAPKSPPPKYVKVCPSIDIRNRVEHLHKLTNCTVIEGSLQILLIDNGEASDYDDISFPDLVEITDYLLLYRAFGLNSVEKLFPNLAVIRGNELFFNYALVVFEMYHLQEIGLTKLTDILHGSVRIEKNPSLCYVDTIDWDLIAKEGKGGHFIKANKRSSECPNTCPENENCPEMPGKTHRLCWNSHNCQKVCPILNCEQNATCFNSTHCCHPECLGGCTGPLASDCMACKHVIFQQKCMKKCPMNTFEYMGRRCIQEDECRNYSVGKKEKGSTVDAIYFKPFNGKCSQECPPGFEVNDTDPYSCKNCSPKCPKICSGMTVDHVGAARKYRGCTRINGSLLIQIQGGSNVIKELEENLNMIEEIDGYLKIARSIPLVSLNFLKSLKVIRGEDIQKKNYTLIVFDNPNLQELWDWKNRPTKLKIYNGTIFFHFNSKLCLSKIKELEQYAEVSPWDDRDVSPNSNGDRVACDVTNMTVTVENVTPSIVKVRWESFHTQLYDTRSLLGYVIYYREAPFKNISMFEGRDACGSDVWTIRDVEFSDDTSNFIVHNISGLKPFTQYALYIRTYMTVSSRQGAQSSILYFKTESDTPSPPVNINAKSPLHGEIVISWSPPKNPNGNVTHYIIEGIYEKDMSYFFYQRNYCSEPMAFPDQSLTFDDDLKYTTSFSNITSSEEVDEDCCSCSADLRKLGNDDDDAEFQIHFEDFLHNKVYVKNPNVARNRRHSSILHSKEEKSLNSRISGFPNYPLQESVDGELYQNGTLMKFKRYVYNEPFLVVSNLRHYTEYTIEVRACQDGKSKLKSEICSTKAITSVRTQPLDGADDIKMESVNIQTENVTAYSCLVRWEEPKESNGIIVSYTVEYKRLNDENDKPKRICITNTKYLERGGYFLTAPPGNYSLRIRATSLARHGNWTLYKYFVIVAAPDAVTLETILAICIVCFLAIAFGSMYAVYKWKLRSRIPDYVDYVSVNPEYMSSNLVYVADEWELPREKVKLLDELGQGSFGMVYKGEVYDLNKNSWIPCAAKTVNESSSLRERIEFLQEASVMKAFNCHHVIKLLGVVSKGQPTLVIMELMVKGDLKTYLRCHRPDSDEIPDPQPPTLKQIFQIAGEIADGMAYLAEKKFVHRDLAARNCMVAEDMTVKIGDFGMTRDVYETDYYRKGGKGLLPVRWMSPESLKDGIFDSQTDVWSYGVVLWEMATLASQPYQGLSNEDVLKFVIAGNTMEKPEDCPEKLYHLMDMCWHKNPKARPTFIEIIEMLLPDVNSKFQTVSYYFTQRPSSSVVDNEDAASPSTPLRSSQEEDPYHQTYRYFPGLTQYPDESTNFEETVDETADSALVAEQRTALAASNSSNGSKNVSVNCSDDSKGSKISTLSNGSVANGHVVHMRTESNC